MTLAALVGNNRVYREWGVLVSYYLPGNSLAPPPSHRASGATAQVVVEHAILESVIFKSSEGSTAIGYALGFDCSINKIHRSLFSTPTHPGEFCR